VLWNSLATVLAENGRVEESITFYQEAFPRSELLAPLSQHRYAWSHLGQLDKALDCYNECFPPRVDPTEQMKASIRLHLSDRPGQIKEGFSEYEIRTISVSRLCASSA